jgi:hypothetical protein
VAIALEGSTNGGRTSATSGSFNHSATAAADSVLLVCFLWGDTTSKGAAGDPGGAISYISTLTVAGAAATRLVRRNGYNGSNQTHGAEIWWIALGTPTAGNKLVAWNLGLTGECHVHAVQLSGVHQVSPMVTSFETGTSVTTTDPSGTLTPTTALNYCICAASGNFASATDAQAAAGTTLEIEHADSDYSFVGRAVGGVGSTVMGVDYTGAASTSFGFVGVALQEAAGGGGGGTKYYHNWRRRAV